MVTPLKKAFTLKDVHAAFLPFPLQLPDFEAGFYVETDDVRGSLSVAAQFELLLDGQTDDSQHLLLVG